MFEVMLSGNVSTILGDTLAVLISFTLLTIPGEGFLCLG